MKNKLYLILALYVCSLNLTTAQQRWQEKPLGLQKLFPVDISVVDAKIAWVVAWSGNFAVSPWNLTFNNAHHFSRTLDSGKTWTSGTFPYINYGYTQNIVALSADTAFIAHNTYSTGGIIYRTTNGGQTWTEALSNAKAINGVHFWDRQNGIALFDPIIGGFGIFKTADGGSSWSRIPVQNVPTPNATEIGAKTAFFNAKSNMILLPTTQNRILRSVDKGETWTYSTIPSPSQEYNAIDCDGRGNCLITGGNYADSLQFTGRFYSSTDSGLTWTASALNQYCGTKLQYIPGTSAALVSVRKNNRLNGGNFKVMLTTNQGQTWQVVDTTRIFAFGMVNNKTGFATEYQNDTTETMAYRYIGSPLSGLWQGEILRGVFDVYPNPVVTDNLNLRLEGFESGEYVLLVNNINGELIHRQTIHFDTKQQIIVPTNLWQSGIYTLTLTSAKGRITRKAVKTD